MRNGAVPVLCRRGAVVANQPRWRVHADDMTLWFFSFAKYLMYRDLDPASWPDARPLTGTPADRWTA